MLHISCLSGYLPISLDHRFVGEFILVVSEQDSQYLRDVVLISCYLLSNLTFPMLKLTAGMCA